MMQHTGTMMDCSRIKVVAVSIVLAISLVACGNTATPPPAAQTEESPAMATSTTTASSEEASAAASPEAETTASETPAPEASAAEPEESVVSEPDAPETSAESAESPVEGPSIVTNGGAVIALSALAHATDAAEDPVVYFTRDISSDAMLAIYEALQWAPSGKVAVKLTTGEPPNSNYLDPSLIKELVQSLEGTIVECNTAYGGSRASTAMHLQVAEDHGFTAIAEVDILDADGSMTLPVEGGTQLSENLVGAHFANYDSYLVLSHFKGHAMAGFGGAIKNISIGLGSREGKGLIHTSGQSSTNIFGGDQNGFQESMGDAGKSVSDYLGKGERITYISVMNHLSVDCDCNGNPAAPDMHDIGILASSDPVALDQACVDLVYVSEESDSLIQRMESRNGMLMLENAEKIGLGSRTYRLVSLEE